MPTIKFTDMTGVVPEDYYPRPSKTAIPEWLKRLQPYSDEAKKDMTAKRCMPMLDAAMAGYTIFLTEDIDVEQTGRELPYYRWPSGSGIDFHAPDQLGSHSASRAPVPKWLSPWGIETPSGYSCLFTPPFNHDGLPFNPFVGVVDTDTYTINVNFPFQLSDPNFEGTVPAGTPIVQVIPFKRESWTMTIESGMTHTLERKIRRFKSKFDGGYRNLFRSPKSFD